MITLHLFPSLVFFEAEEKVMAATGLLLLLIMTILLLSMCLLSLGSSPIAITVKPVPLICKLSLSTFSQSFLLDHT